MIIVIAKIKKKLLSCFDDVIKSGDAMKKTILPLIFLSILSNLSAETTKLEDSKLQAKAVMDGIYGAFVKVIPYVYSDEDSMDILKKNAGKKDELIKNLVDISEFFQSARHVEFFQRPGFKPSLETMNAHLVDTINSIKSNNFIFAQKRLNVLTSLCISCHSQLSTEGASNAFGKAINKSKREDFESDYAYGNYLFLVRHFEESDKYLNLALLRGINESRTHELYTSLRRLISIYTKISFDYKKANEFILSYLKNPNLPTMAKNTLTSWEKSLRAWEKFDAKKVGSIDKFIKTYLAPLEEFKEQTGNGDNDITLLIASGVLSKYLNDHPETKDAPRILYWLSIAERRLSNVYFFTLSDLYLKDCVTRYPKTSYAKKCYNLYENNIELGFTGSSGTDIPSDEKRELARLRDFLKK